MGTMTEEERDVVNRTRKLLAKVSARAAISDELNSEIQSAEEELWNILFPVPVDPESVRAALLRGMGNGPSEMASRSRSADMTNRRRPMVMLGNVDTLTDMTIREWSIEGKHMSEIHSWSLRGPRVHDGLTVRVAYLLEVLDNSNDFIHQEVRAWASIARMTINSINGGGVPRILRSWEFPAMRPAVPMTTGTKGTSDDA